MQNFFPLSANPDALEESAPENIIHGTPRFRAWPCAQAEGGIEAGLWEATPGKWRFRNDCWEYCRILQGVSIVTEDGHPPREVRAGDSFILQDGFEGTWEVLETTLKDYVIRTL